MTTTAAPEVPAPLPARDVVIVPPKAKKHDIREIPLEQLHPHPANRKRFDQVQLEQLADSLVEAGQLTLATVRPIQEGFQLLAGERRWRAAKLAWERSHGHQGRPMLSCVVRALTDLQALQLLASENNQRTDLHPMEEAELFEAFTKIDSLNQARIAKLVSRNEHYVRDRLQLLKMIPPARKLFLEDRFTVKHAVILARLSAKDQARAIDSARSGNGNIGGIFEQDFGLLELDDTDKADTRKAVSVPEFERWVDDHCRFNLADPLIPALFPETAAALEDAKAEDAKVVHITYDHMAAHDAKDSKVRTIGGSHWQRADGQPIAKHGYSPKAGKTSKTCEHSVLGVVAVGPDRGLSFQVCIEKKKCAIHWGDRIRESARHAKAVEKGEPSRDRYLEHERKRKELQEREKAEDARWMKAAPQLFAALAEKVKASPAGARGPLGLRILKLVGRRNGSAIKGADFPIGTSAEDLVRHVAFMLVVSDISDWRFAASATSALKEFGIKAAAIVDQVAPKPKAEPAPAKKRAGDVARAKKKAKG